MIYWITKARPLLIAIVARPRGHDWLEDEVKAVRSEGMQILVSLLTGPETSELGLAEEGRYCSESGIEFLNVPIEDRSVPLRREISDVLEKLASEARRGTAVGFHCRAGIGRSSMLSALLLVKSGWTADAAFDAIAESRGCAVPDTNEQREWVRGFAQLPV